MVKFRQKVALAQALAAEGESRSVRRSQATAAKKWIILVLACALFSVSAFDPLFLCAGDDLEEDEEEANEDDRAFIDDSEGHIQPHIREVDMEEEQNVRLVGEAQMEEEDSKKKNKDRQETRNLQPSTERGRYGDLAEQPGRENFLFLMPCITNQSVPYTCLLQTNTVSSDNNEYLLPEHVEWLRSSQRNFARLFASRPSLPSLSLGGDQQHQELRQVHRMLKQGEDDPFHTTRLTATDKLLYANQVLQPYNGLDCTTADLGGEWVVQMDAATSTKMLHGRRHGGLKGADTTVSLFTIRVLTDMKNDDDLMAIEKAFNAFASDLDYRKKISSACVNTERQELFTQFSNSRIVNDVNIKMQNIYKDTDTRRDSLSYVDPIILKKIAEARGLDATDLARLSDTQISKLMLDCRAEPVRAIQEEESCTMHKFISSHIHVIPSKVRDSKGKIHTVTVEVLRLCAHIEACDPAVALVQMISSGGHSIQDPLLRVTNNMARMLELGTMNMTNMFSCNTGAENIATLAIDANIPLAFFLFLKQNGMSSHEPSPFAANFQCCRIDVYNKAEVKIYQRYVEIVKYSRRKQFQKVRLETQRDYQPGLSRAAHLPVKTSTWDFQNFFSGLFYIAIPKPVYEKNIECVRQQLTSRVDMDWDKFEDLKRDFEEGMADDTHMYVGVHGYPLVSGYICEFNQCCPKEEEVRAAKKRKTTEANDNKKNDQAAVVPLYLWSSPSFQLFMANLCQEQDPFSHFIDETKPDNPEYYSLQKRCKSLACICALQCTPLIPEKRAACFSRACITLWRTTSLASEDSLRASSEKATGVTSTCRSMRSSKGPLMRLRYFCTTPGPHTQDFSGWL